MTHTLSLILTYDFSEGGQLKGDNITIKNILLLFFISLHSILPRVRTVIDHRMCKNMVRTSVTHSTGPPVPLFCSYHILTSSITEQTRNNRHRTKRTLDYFLKE